MKDRFDDNDRKLLPGEVGESANTDPSEESYFLDTDGPEGSDEFYELPSQSASMIWSILSVVCSVLSLALCSMFYLSIPVAILAVGFALLSRKKLGFFDKKSIFGLIIGIFGIVFGVFSMILDLTGVLDKLLG